MTPKKLHFEQFDEKFDACTGHQVRPAKFKTNEIIAVYGQICPLKLSL